MLKFYVKYLKILKTEVKQDHMGLFRCGVCLQCWGGGQSLFVHFSWDVGRYLAAIRVGIQFAHGKLVAYKKLHLSN